MSQKSMALISSQIEYGHRLDRDGPFLAPESPARIISTKFSETLSESSERRLAIDNSQQLQQEFARGFSLFQGKLTGP